MVAYLIDIIKEYYKHSKKEKTCGSEIFPQERKKNNEKEGQERSF